MITMFMLMTVEYDALLLSNIRSKKSDLGKTFFNVYLLFIKSIVRPSVKILKRNSQKKRIGILHKTIVACKSFEATTSPPPPISTHK